jgi:hypothetical protein
MMGRVLFALVWLVIAAGVALPLYPRDIPTSMVAAATDSVQLVAGTDAFDCTDCPVADAGRTRCQSDCACGDAVPAVFVPLEHPVSVTIGITVRTAPASPPAAPQLLFPTLPAI